MPSSSSQASSHAQGAHLLLYDGVCGLCNHLLQFLLARDHRAVFKFASLQSAAGREIVTRWGGDPEALTSFYVIADYRTANARVVTKSDAALFVAGQLGWPWKLMGVAGALPASVRDRLYDVVARYRYSIFGRHERCLVPSHDVRSRFIE